MKAQQFVTFLKEQGVTEFTGVPCSVFKEVIAYVEKHENYYIASNEGEAMGIAAGISLAGSIPAVFMQNDGFGNTVNPLTSLTKLYELPTLMVVSWRGEPGKKDAPQHLWSGRTLIELMKVFDLDYVMLEPDLDAQKEELAGLVKKIREQNRTGVIIVKKGIFEDEKVPQPVVDAPLSREEAITVIADHIQDDTDIFCTTGKPSRELYKVHDRDNNLYVVGSLGCTASIGFGYQKQTGRKVAVVDGDGAILMHTGTLATIGYYKPENFLHICLDNESYESTGGQATVSSQVDLAKVAESCLYPNVAKVKTAEEITAFIKDWYTNPRLSFLLVKVKNVTDSNLGRPQEDPILLKNRFMNHGKK